MIKASHVDRSKDNISDFIAGMSNTKILDGHAGAKRKKYEIKINAKENHPPIKHGEGNIGKWLFKLPTGQTLL
jgi:hypothetical protein